MVLTDMMEDPRNIFFCAHLLFCAKNIERIGDHATNIAETIYYLVTGDALPAERPKGRPDFAAVPVGFGCAMNEERKEPARAAALTLRSKPTRRVRSRSFLMRLNWRAGRPESA
jgi:hypothetical protein